MLPVIRRHFNGDDAGHRLLAAKVLAWFRRGDGVPLLLNELARLRDEPQGCVWDEAGRPVGGFVGEPDTYWQVNQLIVLLGLTGDPRAVEPLAALAAETDAGGPVNEHNRLHWRRIPMYDRIVSLCFAFDFLADTRAIPALTTLLKRPGIAGFHAEDPLSADDQYPTAELEITIARTLARCGGREGALTLAAYLDDPRAVLADHAREELVAITGQSPANDRQAWEAWLHDHAWPPCPCDIIEKA